MVDILPCNMLDKAVCFTYIHTDLSNASHKHKFIKYMYSEKKGTNRKNTRDSLLCNTLETIKTEEYYSISTHQTLLILSFACLITLSHD